MEPSPQKSNLRPVMRVDVEKCVACHRCVSVCPVKFCNNASAEVVDVNPDLCIGCGSCIDACDHNARVAIDDFAGFQAALARRETLIAIVAPAIAANFPDTYLQINGWLKSLGVKAVFDVSFGAELTVKSYLEAIKNNPSECVIAQPCPALVTFIEVYHPELLGYLAPADSPMPFPATGAANVGMAKGINGAGAASGNAAAAAGAGAAGARVRRAMIVARRSVCGGRIAARCGFTTVKPAGWRRQKFPAG